MSDQARLLRQLIESRGDIALAPAHAPLMRPASSRAFVLAVTGGKGGVGKTCVALNLAIALARRNARVALFDANAGLGGVDLLCGLNGYWNLAHVVNGARRLGDVLLAGPENVRILTGASALLDLPHESAAARQDTVSQLQELEQTCDVVVVDTGSGAGRHARKPAAAADAALVVTTPEATSIAEAYTTIKALAAAAEPPRLALLVNETESAGQAETIVERIRQTARLFVHRDIEDAGWIPRDPAVSRSVARRMPFAIDGSSSPAGHAIERLSRRIVRWLGEQPARTSYISRLAATPVARVAREAARPLCGSH
ncbi:MAG: P-loop NTPase [Planctomycetes bacterium]|nr:P-loop NTPase [Planctomycetota bacterium]